MHRGGAAALRARRPYLAISHRNIVLSRRARGKISCMEPDIDTSVAHSARVHDYWLGGCFL
jgi:hypothetical protein